MRHYIIRYSLQPGGEVLTADVMDDTADGAVDHFCDRFSEPPYLISETDSNGTVFDLR